MVRRRDRVFWRGDRAWGDFRDFASVGGKREALVVPGELLATKDPLVAADRAAKRVRELDGLLRSKGLHGRIPTPLAEAASEYLVHRAQSIGKRKVTADWLKVGEVWLTRACNFFGADRDLADIDVEDLERWVAYLSETEFVAQKAKPGAKGRRLSPGTIRHHLNFLSAVFTRAIKQRKRLPPGSNPVEAMTDKPMADDHDARWLEVPDAALVLEAARTLPPAKSQLHDAMPAETAYALVGTFLLTGGREREVLGLEAADISFDRATVTFRRHSHRRLKNSTSSRVVPLHPQLAEILQAYILHRPPSRLLFPSHVTGKMFQDWRKTLDRIAVRAGFAPGDLRTRIFRNTYATARLQCLDRGEAIAAYTVQVEMGHANIETTLRFYAALGNYRHRGESVEYRVEQHVDRLRDRLEQMGVRIG
jgi:integrase